MLSLFDICLYLFNYSSTYIVPYISYFYKLYEYYFVQKFDLTKNQILEMKYSEELDTTTYTYCLDGTVYIIVFNGVYKLTETDLIELFLQKISDDTLLSAEINDKDALTKINSYYGPSCDFHYPITNYKLKLQDLCEEIEFLSYIDCNGDISIKTFALDELE